MYKKAEMSMLMKIILMIIFIILLTMMFSSKIRGGENGINDIFKKYSGPKISITNSYSFKALDLTPSENTGCSGDIGNGGVYNCKKGTALDFSITVENQGLKARNLYTAIIVCKSGETDCCNSQKLSYIKNKKTFKLNQGYTLPQNFGPYTFADTGSYDIYPAVACPVNADTGCPEAAATGQQDDIVTCNNEYHMTFNVN